MISTKVKLNKRMFLNDLTERKMQYIMEMIQDPRMNLGERQKSYLSYEKIEQILIYCKRSMRKDVNYLNIMPPKSNHS